MNIKKFLFRELKPVGVECDYRDMAHKSIRSQPWRMIDRIKLIIGWLFVLGGMSGMCLISRRHPYLSLGCMVVCWMIGACFWLSTYDRWSKEEGYQGFFALPGEDKYSLFNILSREAEEEEHRRLVKLEHGWPR